MLEQSLTEVNEVINHMEFDDVQKISEDFLKMIKDNMDKSYNFKYDVTKKLYEQNLSEDARLLIDIMYIKYLASEEERNYYFTKLLEDKKLDEQQFLNKNIFDKKIEDDFEIQKKDEENDVDLSIIDSNITWYDKLLDKIKNFFNK